jgi:FkbM family methyltransferase
MSRPFISAAQAIYRAMPSQRLRELAFRTFARLVRKRRVVRTIEGMTFELDLSEIIDLGLYLQQWEPDVTGAIIRYTRPGMTVLDIGANIGAHTLRFARLAGREGRVIAYEPTGFAYAKLRRNLSLNDMPQVDAVQVALSDEPLPPQEVNFRASWQTDGSRKESSTTRVAFERLDDSLERLGVGRVDLIKIDVDGNEFRLLAGGRRMLERDRPLMLMEAVGPHFDDDARNPYRMLRELGYRFRLLKGGREVTVEEMRDLLPRNDTQMTTSFNVLAAVNEPS